TYNMFNMEDPVVGGYSLEKIALRRAIAMSYSVTKEVYTIRNGEALPAQSPLAPNITGYDPNFKNVLSRYSPARANALLDVFGYKDCNGDGWREMPGCKPLTVVYTSDSVGARRELEELLQKGMKSIGIRMDVKRTTFPERVKAVQSGTFQFAGAAWGADYPDAEN